MAAAVLNGPKTRSIEIDGEVYCPLCTHTVPGKVIVGPGKLRVVAGQKCPRCSSSLDAGYVFRTDRAA